ncbi:MAG: hypothetical protein ACE5MG_11595 [Candidatus Methylomirabilales bacterium]
MRALTFIIAVVALVMATLAFARTGGIDDLKRWVLSPQTETTRESTAEVLERLKQLVRGEGGSKAE